MFNPKPNNFPTSLKLVGKDGEIAGKVFGFGLLVIVSLT